MKVINSMPRRTPAISDGKNIATSINVVVNFGITKKSAATTFHKSKTKSPGE